MIDEREKWARRRIVLLGAVFGILFLAMVGRSFQLQVLRHEELSKKAENQHRKTIQLTPGRGAILDRNGSSLAESLEMDSCYADPKKIQDPDTVATLLAPVIGANHGELVKKLSSQKNFVWIERMMTPESSVRIKNLKIPGIAFVKETKRYYPNFEVASHVIGFTGLDPNGLEGIEKKYNTTILGKAGYMITERDALGRDISIDATVVKNSSPGKSVILTLDKNIQYITEKELARAVKENGAKSGIAVVMEPDTGKILSMANYPSFNPNSFSKYDQKVLRNRSVADSFEPGSTFKVFLLAAALEEKVIKTSDVFNCENGTYKIADKTIHDDHPHPRLSVPDILKYSSNIGAAKIGSRLGEAKYYRYLKGFGFGERTGIDLPGETSGSLRDPKRWYSVDLATISFGQGVSASAIQLAGAISVIANGGTYMKPYLVERVMDDSGKEIEHFEPQAMRRVVSEETAHRVARMMELVTERGGTGTQAVLEGFRVAGKTGTAQKVDPVSRGYSATKRTASFAGFIPADKPKLVIAIIVDEPSKSPYGGVVAAPAFREISRNALAYLNISPSVANAAKKQEPAQPSKPSPLPPDSENVQEGGALDISEGPDSLMPNFKGMSMRRVLQVMEKKGINIRLNGTGRAVEQNPPPGHSIHGASEVWVKFAPPV